MDDSFDMGDDRMDNNPDEVAVYVAQFTNAEVRMAIWELFTD